MSSYLPWEREKSGWWSAGWWALSWTSEALLALKGNYTLKTPTLKMSVCHSTHKMQFCKTLISFKCAESLLETETKYLNTIALCPANTELWRKTTELCFFHSNCEILFLFVLRSHAAQVGLKLPMKIWEWPWTPDHSIPECWDYKHAQPPSFT